MAAAAQYSTHTYRKTNIQHTTNKLPHTHTNTYVYIYIYTYTNIVYNHTYATEDNNALCVYAGCSTFGGRNDRKKLFNSIRSTNWGGRRGFIHNEKMFSSSIFDQLEQMKENK